MELIYEGVGKKVYRDGDRLIKSFDETYSKADILNEALNQARVEQTSLNIPKILGVSVVDGKWSVIWEFIEGETLEKMMKDHPEKEDEYLDFFVDLQIRMSKEKVPLLGHLRDKMHAKISASSYPASVRYDLHVRLDGLPRHTKLCHGDFQPSNIIITKEGTPYIIDWSHATQGNGSADAARTYLLFKLHKQDELAEKYLRLFCTKTDTAIQYVQRVLPIVAASQSVKHKPEEAEFLAKWVNVCDWQ
ncbi:MAG TPA: phosphotransferase [Candidatus Gallimonas gallistercoris]|uniref:Phosphotransferase n=1 Tax=Candidatus Gallimonas gallistercoris TaxID=2838602 RepID=A0A9D2KFF4_9FIRM|nr:phosphotransferase [Candidatus Gallimonas gallistercoris]